VNSFFRADPLVAAGYLVVTEGEQTYYPARDPEHVRVGAFLRDLRHQGEEFPVRESDPLGKTARDLISSLEVAAGETLDGLTLKDLVQRLADGGEFPSGGGET
jgi:hypothetical protein